MEKIEVIRVVYEEPSTSHRNKINIIIWYDVHDYWKLVLGSSSFGNLDV
jgi:hypothetical protein